MSDTAFAPEPPETDIPVLPEFTLTVFDDGDAVDLHVGVTERPSVRRHASYALLYGLAILTLDQQGVLAEAVDTLLAAGPVSEVDACNRISLLLQQEANEFPI